jgi:nucleoside-diphosphate-sugar epimerase
MSDEIFLVTGARGCIGSWAVHLLADAGTPVVAVDRSSDAPRWRLLDPTLEDRVPLVQGDITDRAQMAQIVGEHGVTHLVHLAALQIPYVRANPTLGARVNVEGMAIILETARAFSDQVRGVSFASSIAVYGPSERYSPGPLPHDAPTAPAQLYGAHKLAGEWMARIYEQDYGVVSIGLRGAVVYGPGRDRGHTCSPTLAMLAAAVGRPYHVAWGGTAGYHYARDVAAAFITAARACADGRGGDTYTLPVDTRTMDQVIAAIGDGAEITYDPVPLVVPSVYDVSAVQQRLGDAQLTPFEEGVRETVETFQRAVKDGRLDADQLLAPR